MTFTNSPLVEYTRFSPNNSGQRYHSIDRISPHCVVGQCTIESLGGMFASSAVQASSNYGIDKDGRVGMFVPESNRSWCTSSSENDNRAVTIECASDTYHPYRMNECVFEKLVLLCADICRRNGKSKLIWIDNKSQALAYQPKADEMLITVHRWFANKSCPGDWLYNRLGELARRVTAQLGNYSVPATTPTTDDGNELYRVRKSWTDAKSQIGAYKNLENAKKACIEGYTVYGKQGKVIYSNKGNSNVPFLVRVKATNINIKKGPGNQYGNVDVIKPSKYTIVEVNGNWGKLKSGAGWICLDLVERV